MSVPEPESVTRELEAMGRVADVLLPLPADERRRVLSWARRLVPQRNWGFDIDTTLGYAVSPTNYVPAASNPEADDGD